MLRYFSKRMRLLLAIAAAVTIAVFIHPMLDAVIWLRNLGLFVAGLSAD